MANCLDRSQCPAAESIPGKVSGAWVFRGTRMPVQTVFDNRGAGMSVGEIKGVFDVTPEEVKGGDSLCQPEPCKGSSVRLMNILFRQWNAEADRTKSAGR